MLNGFVLGMECDINLCVVATQYCCGEFDVYITIFSFNLIFRIFWYNSVSFVDSKIQFSKVTAYKCESTNETTHVVGASESTYICYSIAQLEAIDGDWEDIIDDLITAFEKQHKRRLAYSISFY